MTCSFSYCTMVMRAARAARLDDTSAEKKGRFSNMSAITRCLSSVHSGVALRYAVTSGVFHASFFKGGSSTARSSWKTRHELSACTVWSRTRSDTKPVSPNVSAGLRVVLVAGCLSDT